MVRVGVIGDGEGCPHKTLIDYALEKIPDNHEKISRNKVEIQGLEKTFDGFKNTTNKAIFTDIPKSVRDLNDKCGKNASELKKTSKWSDMELKRIEKEQSEKGEENFNKGI